MSIDPNREVDKEDRDDGPGFVSRLFRTSLNKQHNGNDDDLDREEGVFSIVDEVAQ
jgi:hypothetical protein